MSQASPVRTTDAVRPSAARMPARIFTHIRSDYHANGCSWSKQGMWALTVYRFGRWRYTVRPALIRKAFSLLYRIAYKLVQILAGIELPCEATIGRNFVIDHFGGIVVSGYAAFGDNCRIRPGVVIGLRHVDNPCAPTIGDNVDIGAGAKILGPVKVGNNVLIGANAVVLSDVPDDHVAVGVPAICTPRTRREQVPTAGGLPISASARRRFEVTKNTRSGT